jgi:hypothetical protein
MPGRRCPGARWPRAGWWNTARVSRQEGSSTGIDSCHPQLPSLLPADGKEDSWAGPGIASLSWRRTHRMHLQVLHRVARLPACLPHTPVGPAVMARGLLRPQKGPHLSTKKQSDWLVVRRDTDATVSSRLPAGCGRGSGGAGGAAAGTPAASAVELSCIREWRGVGRAFMACCRQLQLALKSIARQA